MLRDWLKRSTDNVSCLTASKGLIPPSFDDQTNSKAFQLSNDLSKTKTCYPSGAILPLPMLPVWFLTMSPLPAEAAAVDPDFVVQSALIAYAHYASLLVCTAALVVERCTVEANLTPEQEDNLAKVDTVYGLAALGVIVSGVYRVTEYGKGWDFYSHEPLFWLKLALAGVWGASSYFPTIQIIKRAMERRSGGPQAPISPVLAARLKQVMNAELTALLSIPLAATFMSRGVLYSSEIPWQAGAVLATVFSLGLTYKYVKEALTWKEPDLISVASSEE